MKTIGMTRKNSWSISFLRLIVVAAMMIPAMVDAANDHMDRKQVIATGVAPAPEEVSPILYRPVEKSLADLSPRTRTLRVLVHYSKTGFFVANGRPYGLEYDALSEYEKFLNKNSGKHAPRIRITFIPVYLEDLIPYLLEGKGDIAAGQLTITPERQKQVAFTAPYIRNVQEVLVTHTRAPVPQSLAELSGKTIHVIHQSSFVQHLNDLNDKLVGAGRQRVKIVETPANISSSDILEMVNAGIVEYTFVDNFMAELWSKVLPDIKIADDICLNRGGEIAWAVRPDNPALLASMNQFIDYIKHHLKDKAMQMKRTYFQNTKFITNPLEMEAYGRIKDLSPHFKEAGTLNKLDWLMMMAQGYQESELRQNVRSRRGAVGVMQILPKTAKSVGYKNIRQTRNNILAGVAYLNFIRNNYFTDPEIPPDARVDFALAAYNAGPARIQSLRREAQKKGLDPNLWFNHVERIALERIGEEPVRYVANINKYYIAYRMLHDMDLERSTALKSERRPGE